MLKTFTGLNSDFAAKTLQQSKSEKILAKWKSKPSSPLPELEGAPAKPGTLKYEERVYRRLKHLSPDTFITRKNYLSDTCGKMYSTFMNVIKK